MAAPRAAAAGTPTSFKSASCRRSARELVPVPDGMGLVGVAGNGRHIGPRKQVVHGGQFVRVLEAQNPGEDLRRQAHLTAKPLCEVPTAPAQFCGAPQPGRGPASTGVRLRQSLRQCANAGAGVSLQGPYGGVAGAARSIGVDMPPSASRVRAL